MNQMLYREILIHLLTLIIYEGNFGEKMNNKKLTKRGKSFLLNYKYALAKYRI